MRNRTLPKALLAGVLLSVSSLSAAVFVQACSSSAEGTGGQRVRLLTRVSVEEAALVPFTTGLGWSVQLEQAALAAGPFYYFDGSPPLARAERKNGWQVAARFLGLGVAHAHPGHYQAGNALGQMLESSSWDLLGGSASFPDGDGVTGTYRSARLTLAAPSGPAKRLLQGHVALALGVASKGGENSHYFKAFADLSEVSEHASDGKIEGCEFTKADVEQDGTVTVKVDPRVWFDLVDFSTAEAGSPVAPAELPADSDAKVGFVLGVTQLSAYQFSFTPGEEP